MTALALAALALAAVGIVAYVVVCLACGIAAGRIIRAGNRHLGDGEP